MSVELFSRLVLVACLALEVLFLLFLSDSASCFVEAVFFAADASETSCERDAFDFFVVFSS